MTYGRPFDRKEFLKELPYYIEHGYCSYREALEMTMKDFLEIKIGLDSKEQEKQMEEFMGGLQ